MSEQTPGRLSEYPCCDDCAQYLHTGVHFREIQDEAFHNRHVERSQVRLLKANHSLEAYLTDWPVSFLRQPKAQPCPFCEDNHYGETGICVFDPIANH